MSGPFCPIRRANMAILALAAGLGSLTIWLYLSFPHSIVDDAYIYARYARNLAESGQLNWNVGADPVEGYTGVLMPLAYAAAFALGFQFEVFVPFVGLACFWTTGLTLILSNRQEPAVATLVALFYSLTPCIYRHAFSGMETITFACLLTTALAQTSVGFQPRSLHLFSLNLLLLALVRPEGVVFAITMAMLVVLATRNKRQAALAISLLFALPYLAYFLWRWQYYGQVLPNPYYVKTMNQWNGDSMAAMAGFFLKNSFTPALAVLVAIGLALWATKGMRRPGISFHPRGWLRPAAVFLPLTLILLQYAQSRLSMNYSHRFLTPYAPALLLMLGDACRSAAKPLAGRPRLKIGLSAATLWMCGFALIVAFLPAYRAEWSDARLSRRLIQREHIALGKKLHRLISRDEKLVVLKDAGAIPYHSGLWTMDLGGLNDEYLARRRPPIPDTLDYIFRNEPGVFVITSYSAEAPNRSLLGGNQHLLDALLKDQRFDAYILADVFGPPAPGMQYYEFVYIHERLREQYFGNAQ